MNKLGRFGRIFYTLKSFQYFHSFEIEIISEIHKAKPAFVSSQSLMKTPDQRTISHKKTPEIFNKDTRKSPVCWGYANLQYNCCYFSMEVSYSLTNSFPMHPFSKTSGGRERVHWEQMG